jgi:hypothetical protein
MNTNVKFVVLFSLIISAACRPLEHGHGMMKKQISTRISFGEKAKVLAASSPFLKPQDRGKVPPPGGNPCTNVPKPGNGHC